MSNNTEPPKPWYDFSDQGSQVLVGRTGDLGLSGNSFSFMCWVKLNDRCTSSADQYDQTLLAQAVTGMRRCLHITVRGMTPYFGFYGADTASDTVLALHTWYHLAFVYDASAKQQSIYIDGRLDARSNSRIAPLGGNYELFYSYYCNGRPLKGMMANPLLVPRHPASLQEILQHMDPSPCDESALVSGVTGLSVGSGVHHPLAMVPVAVPEHPNDSGVAPVAKITSATTEPPKPWYDFSRQGSRVLVGRTGDLGLSGNSFSFMCWVKLNDRCTSSADQYDQTLLAQAVTGMRRCLHITVRGMTPYFGFYGADTASDTVLALHTWYHLAFVYDASAKQQSIYIDGRLDARSNSRIAPLRGNHQLFYSHYYNGRPLKGMMANPLLVPRHPASLQEILQHMDPSPCDEPALTSGAMGLSIDSGAAQHTIPGIPLDPTMPGDCAGGQMASMAQAQTAPHAAAEEGEQNGGEEWAK